MATDLGRNEECGWGGQGLPSSPADLKGHRVDTRKQHSHTHVHTRVHTHTHTQMASIIWMKHNRYSLGTGDSGSISRCGTLATRHSLKAAVPSNLLPGSPSSTLPYKGAESE